MMGGSIRKTLFATLAGLALSFGAGSVSADTATYYLTVSNLGTTGTTVQVDVTLDSTTKATITFTAQPNYLMFGNGAAAVNVSGSGFTIGNVQASGPFNTPAFLNSTS